MHNWWMNQLSNGSNPPVPCDVWRIHILILAQTIGTPLELIVASRGKS